MSFLSDLLFPPRCAVCGELLKCSPTSSSHFPFCGICAAKWEREKLSLRESCGGQPKMMYSANSTTEGTRAWVMYAVNYIPETRDAVNSRFILKLKNRPDDIFAKFAADELFGILISEMPEVIADGGDSVIVAWIPRSRGSMKKYGFDHMKPVARHLAKRLSARWADCICRRGDASEQKRLSFAQRAENAGKSLVLRHGKLVRGKTVILIDDIVTTGASLGAATALLTKAGARRVVAVTLARTSHYDEPREF